MRIHKGLPGLPLMLPLALGLLLAPASGHSPSRQPGRVVVVVKSRDLAPYNQAVQGLRKTLMAHDLSLTVQELLFPQTEQGQESFLEDLRRSRPDLIITVGTQATRSIGRRIPDVPIVFSLVLMTGDSEVLFRQRPPNVTGAAMDVPIAVQFARLKEIIPDLKRVGVIYNPRLTGEAIPAARAAAAAGSLTLVEIPVANEDQVMKSMEGLKGRVDALWSVADSTVFTPRSVDSILLFTLRDGIPFVGLSPSFVKAGALLSFSCDYEDVGAQSGEIAVEILNGKAPSEMPVTYPRHVSLFLNLNTARAIHLEIPQEVQSRSQIEFIR